MNDYRLRCIGETYTSPVLTMIIVRVGIESSQVYGVPVVTEMQEEALNSLLISEH